jgi:hypothetical protein
VTVNSDYSAKKWNLYLDGTQYGTNLNFYNATATGYKKFSVQGAGSSSVALDDVLIDTASTLVQCSLTVISPYGDPVPSGVTMYGDGALVNAMLNGSSIITNGGLTKYVYKSWERSGCDPNTGASTNMSFNITNDTVITWQWQTNYWVDLGTTGN